MKSTIPAISLAAIAASTIVGSNGCDGFQSPIAVALSRRSTTALSLKRIFNPNTWGRLDSYSDLYDNNNNRYYNDNYPQYDYDDGYYNNDGYYYNDGRRGDGMMGGVGGGGQRRFFGNGEYYNNQYNQYSNDSEDFRRVSKNDRYRRRDDLRYRANRGGLGGLGGLLGGGNNGMYDQEIAFGGRREQMYGGNFGYPDTRYGGDYLSGNVDYRNGNGGTRRMLGGGRNNNMNNNMRRGNNNFNRGSRRMQQDKNEVRYGYQQQYNTARGNVRNGSSNDFRRGSSINTIQDYYTPKQREIFQRQDNQGARYGYQQQYDVMRGNVRNGSSNDFRRGSSYDKIQDFRTPREREMRQMEDNRMLSRGIGYNNNNYGGGGVRRRGGRQQRQNDYYDAEIMYDDDDVGYYDDNYGYNDYDGSGYRSSGSSRNRWGGFKGFFNTGF